MAGSLQVHARPESPSANRQRRTCYRNARQRASCRAPGVEPQGVEPQSHFALRNWFVRANSGSVESERRRSWNGACHGRGRPGNACVSPANGTARPLRTDAGETPALAERAVPRTRRSHEEPVGSPAPRSAPTRQPGEPNADASRPWPQMSLKTSEAVGGREVDGRGDEDECRGQSDGPAKDDELRPGCGDVRVELAGGFEPLLGQREPPPIAGSRTEGGGLPPDRPQPLRFERCDPAAPPEPPSHGRADRRARLPTHPAALHVEIESSCS